MQLRLNGGLLFRRPRLQHGCGRDLGGAWGYAPTTARISAAPFVPPDYTDPDGGGRSDRDVAERRKVQCDSVFPHKGVVMVKYQTARAGAQLTVWVLARGGLVLSRRAAQFYLTQMRRSSTPLL